jgi:oligopeptide/dipeptide ABC transporter ATP-binding protein
MYYDMGKKPVKAIRNISLEMEQGDILGLVGESGCGKSALLLTIMGLIPYPGKIVEGEIVFEKMNLRSISSGKVRRLRGRKIAMVFQDPMTTLNPVFKVGEQIREALRVQNIIPKQGLFDLFGRKNKEIEIVHKLMREVGIPSEENRYSEFPHQFSGGMQQRALIAVALSCEPDLLLADEPTTALDVTIQAQIVALLEKINRDRGTGIILVTHDLALAAEFCRRIAVMYAGEIVEQGETERIIHQPQHPYTKGLLKSIPKIVDKKERIEPIQGTVPDLAELPEGCSFYERCKWRKHICLKPVKLEETEPNYFVRCARCEEIGKEAVDE